ncbi:Ycf49-like protein [Rhynchospora pubera]|uniref:Ycf49-like protein n=1 Tax=Rhynchospora pubera TaxID=906938 RepID=A0AAV8ALQ8_9POAL|nr:Ycf49-like protein [Rhynchospora pubera]
MPSIAMASTKPPLSPSLPSLSIRASSSPLLSKVETHESNFHFPSLVLVSATASVAMATAALPPEAAASSFPLILGALQEPSNALSLPTWAVHVSSVVEWIAAMALVWEYGEKSGHTAWKGLSWGMVPLLGGALCACTWHFFYNAESLEVKFLLVAIQGALTTIGNITMLIAAFRIFKASQESSSTS